MATVDENRDMWATTYSWIDGGEEWSTGWGNSEMHWHAWIRPRLLAALRHRPDLDLDGHGVVVEIGCGHGRWTRFLAASFDTVEAVDLVESCVAESNRRFADEPTVRAVVCDGVSLPGVADRSVDVVFSFDSLVHADAATIGSYVAECDRVLADEGIAFLHHSNLAACPRDRSGLMARPRLRRPAALAGLVESSVHWRDPTVDADLVVEVAAARGLHVRSQELLRWGTRRAFIDCLSVLERGDAQSAGPPRRLANPSFMSEMARAGELWSLHGPGSG